MTPSENLEQGRKLGIKLAFRPRDGRTTHK
jgi:hypothetical protein